MLLVAFLAVSIFATLFALPANSWSQEECNLYCWAERALVSTVVIGGFASLIIGGWRMRGGDGRSAAIKSGLELMDVSAEDCSCVEDVYVRWQPSISNDAA